MNPATLTVAADGGANVLHAAGLPAPDVIAGDLDSIGPEVWAHYEQQGSRVLEDRDENAPDFAKALRAVHTAGASAGADAPKPLEAILVFGGLDGRADQAFAQLHQLYAEAERTPYSLAPASADSHEPSAGSGGSSSRTLERAPADGPPVYLVAGANVAFVLREGRNVIHTRRSEGSAAGRCVGIIPLGRPAVVSTKGLQYDVADWPTSFGTRVSTSNYVARDDVVVTTDVKVLFCIDLDTP